MQVVLTLQLVRGREKHLFNHFSWHFGDLSCIPLSACFMFATAQAGTVKRWLWGGSSQCRIDTIHDYLTGENHLGKFADKAMEFSFRNCRQEKIFQDRKKKI